MCAFFCEMDLLLFCFGNCSSAWGVRQNFFAVVDWEVFRVWDCSRKIICFLNKIQLLVSLVTGFFFYYPPSNYNENYGDNFYVDIKTKYNKKCTTQKRLISGLTLFMEYLGILHTYLSFKS